MPHNGHLVLMLLLLLLLCIFFFFLIFLCWLRSLWILPISRRRTNQHLRCATVQKQTIIHSTRDDAKREQNNVFCLLVARSLSLLHLVIVSQSVWCGEKCLPFISYMNCLLQVFLECVHIRSFIHPYNASINDDLFICTLQIYI